MAGEEIVPRKGDITPPGSQAASNGQLSQAELRQQIEQAQLELGRTVDAITDLVKPSNVARRAEVQAPAAHGDRGPEADRRGCGRGGRAGRVADLAPPALGVAVLGQFLVLGRRQRAGQQLAPARGQLTRNIQPAP